MKKNGIRYQVAAFRKNGGIFDESFEHEYYLVVKTDEEINMRLWDIEPGYLDMTRCYILLDDGQFIDVYPESFRHVFKIQGTIKKGRK